MTMRFDMIQWHNIKDEQLSSIKVETVTPMVNHTSPVYSEGN